MPRQMPLGRLFAFVFLLALLPATTRAGETEIDRTIDVEPGKELTIDFESMRGDIVIEGWDRSQVSIKGSIHGRDWEEDDDLEVDERSSGVVIAPSYRPHDRDRIAADLVIRVPNEFDVRLRAATETRITNLQGRVELSVANSHVKLNNVQGEAYINTANGKLYIENCTLDGDISNVNGRLSMDGSTISGEVASTNGNLSVSSAPDGLDVRAVNGNVDIGSAAEMVHIKTVNGRITIDELDGAIEAETVNGAVRLRMVGDPDRRRDVEIETLNGDVEIEIPENFSMEFDVEARDEDGRSRYDIISDFDLNITESESRRGRYRITGTGSIGGGKNKVHIRAGNGDVILKKVAASN